MTRAQKLLRLQELEDDLREKMALYKKVQAAMGDSPALREAAEAAATTEAQLAEERAAQSRLEDELRQLDAKLKRESGRLYDGSVQSHRDVENLQREVESLQRRRGDLDEQALRGMDRVEKARRAFEGARDALTVAEQRWDEEKGDLGAREQKLKRYISARRREREAALAEIAAADLTFFRSVQERKGSRAVAALRDSVCTGCGVNVSAAKVAQVRASDDLIPCGNCGRILAR